MRYGICEELWTPAMERAEQVLRRMGIGEGRHKKRSRAKINQIIDAIKAARIKAEAE